MAREEEKYVEEVEMTPVEGEKVLLEELGEIGANGGDAGLRLERLDCGREVGNRGDRLGVGLVLLDLAGTKTLLEELGFTQSNTLLEKLSGDDCSGGVRFWMTRSTKHLLYRDGSIGS